VFAIELRSSREAGEGKGASAEARGTIVIGNFTETFTAALGFWDESDYRRSWRRAFEVLEVGPGSASCLMTSVTDPRSSNFLVCWPMYREGEDVYVQHAVIFLDEVGAAFDPAAPWGCVGPRSGDGRGREQDLRVGHVHGVAQGVLRVGHALRRCTIVGVGMVLYLSDAANADHSLAPNPRVTPSRSVVSRTITPSADATSTHCPPLLPL
jgi:hypothetical protein